MNCKGSGIQGKSTVDAEVNRVGNLRSQANKCLQITAPLNNMWNLKFKSPPMVVFSRPSINLAVVFENE